MSGGLVDHLALRTTAIDRALTEALEAGVLQVVLLGAGLDARPYRMPGLSKAVVFEVDHPSTQRMKKERCAGLKVEARELVYVSVDFARDSLDQALEGAGHRRDQPSFWIWEGVTMYLPPEATRATLEVVGARSAPGSRVAVTYLDRSLAALPFPIRKIVEAPFRLLGEPLVGEMLPQQMVDLLANVHFRVVSDEHSVDWEHRFGGSSLAAIAYRMERLAVAEKQPARAGSR
jgi:methyltransferase (TIGR00027 family)